jgi:hypothetical protein
MYADLLSQAMSDWPAELTDDALLHYTVACRAALPQHDLGAGGSAHISLVAEIAYDLALINLAATRGIDVSPHNFCHPLIERLRLEGALARQGLDLRDPAVCRPATPPPASRTPPP